MLIDRLDHLVLTVNDIETTVAFYTTVLGMEKIVFGQGRVALSYGQQKINLHQRGKEFEPKAQQVQTGSADLCFISRSPLSDIIAHWELCHIPLLEGPVKRTGAVGPIESVYCRDPDGNLIEVANYLSP